jgi:hypothetical protein
VPQLVIIEALDLTQVPFGFVFILKFSSFVVQLLPFFLVPFEPTLGLGTFAFRVATLVIVALMKSELVLHTPYHFHYILASV